MDHMTLKSWQKVWRNGIAPQLSTEGLRQLLVAIVNDQPRLLQGVTCEPLPCPEDADKLVTGACAITLCGLTRGTTVAEAEEFFAGVCFECDMEIGEPAGCRWFLNWYDDTPRNEMRIALEQEVRFELSKREFESMILLKSQEYLEIEL